MMIHNRAMRITKALEPLVADLLSAKVRLNAARDIHFLHKEDYPLGLPIVLAHLQKQYDDLPKAVMAGALYYTKNEHTQAIWPQVAKLYSETPNTAKPFEDDGLLLCDSSTKRALANALIRLYEPKRVSALIELVRDARNGQTRVILLDPLIRVRNRRKGMMDILMELKTDPALDIELTARGVGNG